MLLGDVITRLTDEIAVTETLLGLDDLTLLSRIRARADESGVTLGAYAVWAFRTYVDNASSEEWMALISAMSRSPDPGGTCLGRAFAYVLTGVDGSHHGSVLDD